ncbi:DUF5615 family PIN-like protein [Candidatus Nitrospira allomarina]|uniref:DUF5615 family PIN-like protein n=1 Tax=Candidatus Nitrospira allomarina TaxID=3020900 RepID=UPI0035E3C49B
MKLDENLPVRLARALEKLGHDTDTIPEEGLTGRSDLHIESPTPPPSLHSTTSEEGKNGQ